MRKLKLFFACLLMAVLSIGQVWASDPVTIVTGTFDGKNSTYTTGWSTTGTGKTRTDCIVIGSGENITSPSIDLSDYESISITFTGRRFGTLSNSKAVVNVAFAGSNIGSIDITNGSVGAVSGSVDHTITTETTGTFVFTCTNATSAGSTHGAGIGSITISGVEKSSTPAVAYTVSFNVGGGATSQADITEASAGEGITLPAGPEATCKADGWVFAGWKETSAVSPQTTTAPTLLVAGTNYKPASDCTLYAVYKKTEAGGGSTTKSMTSFDAISGNVENDANVSYAAAKGTAGTAPAVNNNEIRIYQNGGLLTITANNGVKLNSITIGSSMVTKVTYAVDGGSASGNNDIAKNGTFTVDEIDATEVIFTCTGTDKNSRLYLNNLSVTYSGGGTTYYLSNPTCTPPAVADPVISLASGEYEGTQSVTISCETTGAKIYYTTDESDPTASSTLYNGAISVSASQTIKAIAIKDEVESSIVSAEYTIITTCETPTFSLAAGSYEGTQSVEISCTRAGVTIYYTTDGSDPTNTSSVYSSALSVSSTQTIKAIATKSTLENSAIASATYTITAGPDVTLDFLDGKWSFPTSYTKTATEYTNSETSYAVTCYGTGDNGFKITDNYFIIGKQDAYIQLPAFSNPVEKIVVVKGNGDNPSGSVKMNIFDGETAASTEVQGCTTDKEFTITNPKSNNQYTLKITSNHNLQIAGFKIYFGEAPAVAQPSIVGNAAFVGSQDVTISCETEGADIYYTTDATKKDNPSTETWSAYDTKVTIDASCTLYAAATDGEHWSSVASKEFTATPLYTTIAALQGVATTTETTVFVQITNWLVTAVSGSNAYVTDGTGNGMILYKYGHGFVANDKLNKAQLETTLQFYTDGGCAELKNLTTADFAGDGELVHDAEITPIVKTVSEFADLTVANQGALFKVNNLTYDATNGKFVNGTDEVAYYNKFNIDESALVDGHTYNVTGVAVYHKAGDVVQLCPRTAADLSDNTAYVQIEFNANTTGSYGGTLPTTITNHISGTDYTIPAASLTREDGYYQLGWNTDPAATTALTSLENVTTNQTLYAIWKETANCTISFFSKGQLYDTKVKAQNAEYDFNDVVAPSVQGWTFYGWSADEIATEQASATKLTSVTPTSETMTLYAIFSRKVDGTPYTQYEKVTAEPSNWSGEYLLVYESGSEAFNSAIQTFDVAYNGIDVTINEGVIASNATVDAAAITIAPMTGGYSILGANGKYVGATSYANAIATSDDPIANSLSLSGEDAVIGVATSGGTVTMRYNSATDQLRFRYYKSGQKAVQLYRKNTIVPQVDVYTTAPVVRFNITFTLASGEEGIFNPISVVQGDDQELPVAVPTKANHTFNKWTDGVNLYAAGATIENVQADIELSATWTENSKANVTFDVNGASGSVAAIENVYEGTDYTLPAAPTYDDDHAFAGWKLGDDVFAAGTVRQMSTPAAALEYKAQWNTIVEDQVVIVVEYDETTYALSNNAGDKRLYGIEVNYKYGNFYGVSETDKAAIIWTRRTVGNNVTFRIGTLYLTGKSNGTDLTLGESPCVWTLTEGNYLIGERTFLYQAGTVNAFRGYKTSEAGAGAYSSMPEMAQPKFNTTYTRPDAVQGQLGTICVPNGGRMEGATPFEIAYMDYDADHNPYKIYLDEVEEMVAGRPYFFLAEDENPEVKVYYTDEENVATAGNYHGLYGTFNQIDQLEQGYYIVYNNMYYHVNSDNVKILANRAYIKLSEIPGNEPTQDPDPTKVRRRISMGAYGTQTTTGIDALNASEAPVKMIIDGKLYILRGEKMYNANGQLVK